MPAKRFESYLPEMALLIGQSDMPKARLDRAPKLRAIINIETNFLQNVDYDVCFERGIHVLAPGSAFAKPVAEMALGMAIDLCRGVTAADRAMRAGKEKWLLEGAEGCFSLYGARVGLIGFGDLARAFVPLLQPFGCPVKAYDPVGFRSFHGWLRRRRRFARGGFEDEPGHHRVRRSDQREPGLLKQARVRDDYAGLGVPADEPGGRGRLPRVPAAGRERALPRSDRRLSRGARARRRAERARSRVFCYRRTAPAR